MTGTFLSHVAYSVGAARPIDQLEEDEGLSPDLLAAFHQRGLDRYRHNERSLADMCVASAVETLDLAGIGPEDVDSILVVSSNADAMVSDDDETALFVALHEAGLRRGRIIGLTLQACSAFADAMRVAGGLAASNGGRPVLVVVFGQKQKTSRLGPQENLVFSDGAASCLVSADGGAFEFLAGESITNTELATMGRGGNIAQFQGGLMELREVTRGACAKSGVRVEDLRAFLGTNAGIGHLELMANATGIPSELIYADDVPRFSHVHSCDNLISLKNYAEAHALEAGDTFLLLGWSPHVFSAAVLRYLGT